MTNDVLTVTEAAAEHINKDGTVGCRREYILAEINRKKIEATKYGMYFLIERKDWDKYLKSKHTHDN